MSVDKALHILFAFLPLLWTLGILPPLDALFSWLAEQVLVLVLGGSPMATDLRSVTLSYTSHRTSIKNYDLLSIMAKVKGEN